MAMLMMMRVLVTMLVGMFVIVIVRMLAMMVVIVGEVDVELYPGYGGSFLPRYVQVIAVEFELLELALQPRRVHAQVKQGADEHVAGDTAEDVKVERFHHV
jgi:hypothetical protein